MEISKYLFAGIIILVVVVSFAAGSMFTGGLPTIDATGRVVSIGGNSEPSGQLSEELQVSASGSGFNDRYGYFMPDGGTIYLTASKEGSSSIEIYVDGSLAKTCDSSRCEHSGSYSEGVHVYGAFSNGLVTKPRFFVVGTNTHANVGDECKNPTLDFSKDGFVDVNDMQKISEVIATGMSCPGLSSDNNPCDMNKDGSLNNQDMILLAEKVNSCFK